jgi:hypothetical protein
MKKFSAIHIPPLSFFSKELYSDVALHWRGVNFLYLLLLLAICWIPIMIKLNNSITQFVDNEAPRIVEQVPKITITNGEASIDEPQPYYIKAPDSNSTLAIIDTTGTIKSLDNTGAYLLLTKKTLIVRQSDVETRAYSLAQVKNFVLTSDRLMKWLHIFKKIFIIILYPLALLSSFIFRIIQALIYGAIGLLFASWCRIKLSYDALIRLSVIAVTPCIIISTVLLLANVHLSYDALIYFLIAMAYLLFGVKATAGEVMKQQEVQPPEQPPVV